MFLKKLLDFYEEDPNDPFNLYALALEYQKFDMDKASSMYDELLANHPKYLPTYYHAAQFFGNLEEVERAENIYSQGIQLAQEQRNNKAEIELTRAYRSFQDDRSDW